MTVDDQTLGSLEQKNAGGKILLAAPRGYCAGVDRAVDVVEKALDLYGAPVYVRKEIVHNKFVVESLSKRGAIFVQETDQVPEGAPSFPHTEFPLRFMRSQRSDTWQPLMRHAHW